MIDYPPTLVFSDKENLVMKIEEQASQAYLLDSEKPHQNLPASEQLNINAFANLFDKTTNSYKPLFFLSLLNKLQSSPYKNTLTFEELAIEMVVMAWYPIKYFHLSFGKQDQLGKVIENLVEHKIQYAITNPFFKNELREQVTLQYKKLGLTKLINYVPFRLLTPFYSDHLRGMKDAEKNEEIKRLATETALQNTSIYSFTEHDSQSAIQINPIWESYLRKNHTIIYRWALWEWSNYLQKKNPNTPAILNKITPPSKRQSLVTQTKIWMDAINAGMKVKCIYTGEAIDDKSFALDHFLPWSYVCHNQLWNLTPVTNTVNSQKSNHLPPKLSIQRLANQQYEFIRITSDLYEQKKWDGLMESHMNDLHLEHQQLLSRKQLQTAYQNTMNPLLSLAQQAGFSNMKIR